MIIAGIPAYNEEKTIARVVILAQRHVDMVVVCDDGSSDFTGDIAQRLGAVVIRHEKNLGYGAAIRTLFRKARAMNADVMLTFDGDGQHDPTEIPDIIQPILEDKADVVVGSRFLHENDEVPAYRRFGIKLLTRLSNNHGEKNTDAQSGFRAYSKKAIRNLMLHENGMGVSAEILMKAREEGLRVAEVPVQTNYKGLDTSTHNPVRHGFSVLATILKLVVEDRPLFYLGIPGTVVLLVGLAFGFWTLQLFVLESRVITNVALASAAFTLVGIFMVFTALTLYGMVRLSQKQLK